MPSRDNRSNCRKPIHILWPLLFAVIAISLGADRTAKADPERLSIAYCIDCVPFQFQDETGEPAGLIIDYWRLWSEKTGIALDFTAAPWDETLQMVGDGALDAHAGLFFSEERDRILDYGTALRKTDTHVFFHRSIPATTDLAELAAYRIGVIAQDTVESFLKERVPGGVIRGYADYATLFAALEAGELKVFAADTPTGLYHLKQADLLSEFTFVADGPLYRSDWFTAAQDGDSATVETVNRGMALISEAEQRDIARRWIGDTRDAAEDDSLIIAIDRGYAPFTFMNAQGRPAGLFVDLWQAWADKTGRNIRFRPSSWAETLEGLKAGEVDIHSGLSYSDRRAEWIAFSQQTYRTVSRIYHRSGEALPADIGAFGDRRLGTWAGSYQEAEVVRLYPQARLRSFPTTTALIDALVNGEIDAALQEERVMDNLLREMGLQGDIVSRPERLFVSTIHAGVLRDNASLVAEIDNGLALLSGDELAALEARWVTDPEARFHGLGMADSDVGLSPAERVWLNDHPILRLGADPSWIPYEYLDDQGVHHGLSAEIVSRIEKILGITFQPPPSLPWAETVARLRNGELDMVAAVAPTEERQDYLAFSEPYMSWPNVIATRADASPVNAIDDLAGKRVGVVDGYAIHEILAELHPELELLAQGNVGEGLRALAGGQLDAFIDSPVTIAHAIEQLQIADLAVVAETPYMLELALGVRKDWPELAAALDKALRQITVAERLALAEAAGLPTAVAVTKLAEKPADVLTLQETLILAGVVLSAVGLIVALVWTIRTQRRPFLRSLRGKSIVFIGGVFILIGGATIWAFLFVGDKISAQLGAYVAERHVLWQKEKVLGAVQRELALARQMASSEILFAWSEDETDTALAAQARRELQEYHDNFASSTYFVGLRQSGHFFYADADVSEVALDVVDTLSRDDIDDVWFFVTLEDTAPYNLNIDHNTDLGVTNLWVNYAMRRGGASYGVVGTGVPLTDFIKEFVRLDAKGISTMMIDKSGAIQAHVDQSKITQNVLAQATGEASGIWGLLASEEDRESLRRNMARLQNGTSDAETFFLTIDGTRNLLAMAYLEPLGWYTLAAFEPGSIIGLEETGTLAVVLGIALLITLVVFVIGQNVLIVRPLARLNEGANRMSGGDYDLDLVADQQDEVGDLTQTFNEMAAIIADYTGTLEARVEARTHELNGAYEVISSSIQYASRIQRSILPDEQLFQELFSDYFVHWEPRDVVGGDFYWCKRWGRGMLLVLGDCTGHGVPGAFMTMIANGALDMALLETPPGDTAILLLSWSQEIGQGAKVYSTG